MKLYLNEKTKMKGLKMITKVNKLIERLPMLSSLFKNKKKRQTLSIPKIEPASATSGATPAADSFKCPYCLSRDFVKRGFRKKKLEKVQLFLCKTCGKTFTHHITKGKHYPLNAVLEGISLYNLGYSLEKSCRILNQNGNFSVHASSLANWISEFEDLCRFSRMRHFALKKYSPQDMVIYATLSHQQFFRYRFHRAKCELMIKEDFKHRKFWPLMEFLEMVPTECPHQFFQKGLRASEAPMTFSKIQMIVRSKTNYANRLCRFVLQSVKDRKKKA